MVSGLAASSAVQAGEEAEGFTLSANSAYCEPGYLGPFVGCTPWEGLVVTFESSDAAFSESCTTVAGDRTAGCTVVAPFGSTITASIDPVSIPAGFVLEGQVSQEIQIPAGPPEGEFGGAVFVLFAEDDGDDGDNGVGSDNGDNGDVSGLPETGSGATIDPVLPLTTLLGGLLAAAVTLALGALSLRRRIM